MTLTRRSIIIFFIANNLLAFLCAYLLDPRRFFSYPEMFWQLLLGITVVSVFCFILSRIAEVALENKYKSHTVYFWGQAPATLLILGFFFNLMMGRMDREDVTIAGRNREFISHGMSAEKETLRYKALHQLENAVDDKNDLWLHFYNMYKGDTVINGVRDSVTFIYFLYTHRDHPGDTLNSKHMIGEKYEKMIYYNLTYLEANDTDNAFMRSWRGYKALERTRRANENGQEVTLTADELRYFENQGGEMKLEQ